MRGEPANCKVKEIACRCDLVFLELWLRVKFVVCYYFERIPTREIEPYDEFVRIPCGSVWA